MGMYDSLLISQSLLEDLCKSNDINLKPFNGYYDFQTKDLDNSLTIFHLESDGLFFHVKQDYEYKEPDETTTDKWRFGRLKPVGPPQMVEDTRSCYIDFYDLFNTEEERVFVTFTAHIKNGKLSESISIKSIERTNLKEESERIKKSKEQWAKIQDTWQWQLASFISETRWKITRFFKPFVIWLDCNETKLREKAKSLHERID